MKCIFNNLKSVIVEQKTEKKNGKKKKIILYLKCSITTDFQDDVKPLRRHSY